jgi:hypothetical protein
VHERQSQNSINPWMVRETDALSLDRISAVCMVDLNLQISLNRLRDYKNNVLLLHFSVAFRC